MLYNINTMSDKDKYKGLTAISEADYIDIMFTYCAQVICFEYESKFCSCETARDCHGSSQFIESAKACVGIIGAFGENVYKIEYRKDQLN